MSHQRSLSGKSGVPSKMTEVAWLAERPVDDVGVAGDPADVGGAEVDVRVGLEIEDVVVGRRRSDQVAGGGVDDSLRLGGGAARVHEEEQVFGIHRLTGAAGRVAGGVLGQVVEAKVAALRPGHVAARVLDDQHLVRARNVDDRLVGDLLQPERLAAPVALVLRDHDLGLEVVGAIGQRLGREAAEDDAMRGADAGAGEHGNRQLRDHAEIDRDRRSLLHADRLETLAKRTTSSCRSA